MAFRLKGEQLTLPLPEGNQPIDRFDGVFRFLSNFYPGVCTIRATKGSSEVLRYDTVEQAYQALKTLDPDKRRQLQFMTPGQAKRAGRSLALRPGWEDIKVPAMRGLLRQKFQHPELKELLLATGDCKLVEGNTWGDTFWGVCKGVGQNQLGKLLMEVREELRQARGEPT